MQELKRRLKNKYKVGGLFSGVGNEMGFEQAGFSIEWANEFTNMLVKLIDLILIMYFLKDIQLKRDELSNVNV